MKILLLNRKLNNKEISELTKEIIKEYIEKIKVYEDEKIDVILKYEGEIIEE